MQRVCRELQYKPDLGNNESTEQVVYGLALLASLGRQAEAQLLQLKEKGCADRPIVWIDPNESLDDFQIRTSIIAPSWDLTRESYPEFEKLKILVIGPKMESGSDNCVFADIVLVGTGLVFNPKRGRVERRVLSDRVLNISARVNAPGRTTWGKPVEKIDHHITYWVGGSGQGERVSENRDVDLKRLREYVACTIVGQTRYGSLRGEMPQVGRARSIVKEWLEKDRVCEQWVSTVQDCCQTTLNMASEILYAKESIPIVMES